MELWIDGSPVYVLSLCFKEMCSRNHYIDILKHGS